jgi:hypothetical protein
MRYILLFRQNGGGQQPKISVSHSTTHSTQPTPGNGVQLRHCDLLSRGLQPGGPHPNSPGQRVARHRVQSRALHRPGLCAQHGQGGLCPHGTAAAFAGHREQRPLSTAAGRLDGPLVARIGTFHTVARPFFILTGLIGDEQRQRWTAVCPAENLVCELPGDHLPACLPASHALLAVVVSLATFHFSCTQLACFILTHLFCVQRLTFNFPCIVFAFFFRRWWTLNEVEGYTVLCYFLVQHYCKYIKARITHMPANICI